MNEIDISHKYQPLFELLEGEYPEVDTVILTGGRASGKSYSVGTWSIIALTDYQYNILYTRFTNSSIIDSVKPEVSDKVELLGKSHLVNDTITHVECGECRIAFKGIKTGSKQQTANLKSLSGFNVFVVDEAEELPDYETFKKVFYSIRSVEKRNLNILLLNPTSKDHWIYKELFEKNDIPDGFNGVHQNIMYIHTSYLDVNPKYIPENIRKDYDRLKIDDPEKYDNIVMGGWIKNIEGLLLPASSLRFDDVSKLTPDKFEFRFAVGDPADKGGDKYAMPFMWCHVGLAGLVVYVTDAICNTYGIMENTPGIIERMRTYSIDHLFLESNGVGLAAVLQMKEKMKGATKLTTLTASENKEVRILGSYEFIQKYFIFDSNYKDKPQYNQFMKDLTSYIAGGDNKHRKDAIDVLCTAAELLKIKFSKFIY
jgi:hypothetical protein